MKYSKETLKFSDYLVYHYAKYNELDDRCELSLLDIPDFDLHEFTSLLMSENDSVAYEATGPDNIHYEKYMLPSLVKFLQNTMEKDNEKQFLTTWKEGTTKYFENTMEKLLANSLDVYNNDHGYTNTYPRQQEERMSSRRMSL